MGPAQVSRRATGATEPRPALAAAEWVRRHRPGAFPQVHRDLFDAHVVPGEDLEDPAVIDRHASESGIDLSALHAGLADGSAAAAVAEAETLSRTRGVRGTPAWLSARRLTTGLLPPADFERLAEYAMRRSR